MNIDDLFLLAVATAAICAALLAGGIVSLLIEAHAAEKALERLESDT